MWKDRLSRLSGGRGKPRHHLWRRRAIGSDGIDSGYARDHPEEDLCLAHRLWGEKASGGHYDLTFLVMCLVIVITDGGRYVLLR